VTLTSTEKVAPSIGGLPSEPGGGDAPDERGVAGEGRVERGGGLAAGVLEEVGRCGVGVGVGVGEAPAGLALVVVGVRGDAGRPR
jgi:hypothetical protein